MQLISKLVVFIHQIAYKKEKQAIEDKKESSDKKITATDRKEPKLAKIIHMYQNKISIAKQAKIISIFTGSYFYFYLGVTVTV